MNKKYVIWALIATLLTGTVQSCGIFKKGCGCPSATSGKQR